MTHEQAVALLDRVRDGALYPPHIVDVALMMTGDLCDYRSDAEEILWQMSAGETARGRGGYVENKMDLRKLLDTPHASI